MPRVFYGVKEDSTNPGYYFVVNHEGSPLSINGYPLTGDDGKHKVDKFGCSNLPIWKDMEKAQKQADEWERSCLIFNKPRMSSRELFFMALSQVDWFIAFFCLLALLVVVTK